ncbi:MAG: Lrp/AsnC family transcriptional regulator [Candidatus Adiutrix sp.]|jgi:DNA-binding Lrp family transcriptional regulator|nr:Lrp/AsnC family transcriptional regulator [Candidatus Adiutrix sp.]
MTSLNDYERRLIHYLSGDMGDSPTPFAELAGQLGVSEDEVLETVRGFQSEGLIRRFGATLWHQRSGFAANAMVVFKLDASRADECGQALARLPYVSHCYRRRPAPGWPFNLYAMAHAENRVRLMEMAAEMAEIAGAEEWRLLESQKEFKKTSLRLFDEAV